MELTPEQIKRYNEQSKKVEKALKELGPSHKRRAEIITGRFGGVGEFTSYCISQVITGFASDRNLTKAYLDCADKRDVIAMVGACTEVGYMIAEERYEQKVKMLEAKLMIAESEIKKLEEE